MEKALFSHISNELVKQIRSAKSSIKIAMAWFTSDELFSALIDALNRDVRVELILLDNATNWQPYAPDFNNLIQKGGTLKIAGSNIGFLHHKFCIIDHRCLVTGSYNWTYYAETRNIENVLFTEYTQTISAFNEEFERLSQMLEQRQKAPRYTWEDISVMDDIDFAELQTEINCYTENKHLPTQTIIKVPKPTVTITTIERKVYAKYDIGIYYEENNGNPALGAFIHAGDELPKSPASQTWYNDATTDVILRISRRNSNGSLVTIHQSSVREIIGEHPKRDMPIEIHFELDKDALLKVTLVCKDTNRRTTIQQIDEDLVESK